MITRQKLIDQIEKYKPYNEQEEKDKILILDWIRNNENAFFRENADYVVVNNGDFAQTRRQIEEGIRKYETL